MNSDLQSKFQAIANEGNTFSVTLPEVVAVPAVPSETVEFKPA